MLHCPKCRAEISPADVDTAMQAARCRSCRRLVDLAEQLGTARAADGGHAHIPDLPHAGGGGRVSRAPVPMPRRFRMEDGPSLRVRWRWFNASYLFLVFFCLFWDGFLVLWYGVAFATRNQGASGPTLVMLLFPLLHVAVGAGLTYFTICGFVNATTVEAGSGRLTVKHGPLPWPGNVSIDTAQLEQLFTEEVVTRTKNGGSSRSYTLSAVERDGVSRKLLAGLPEASQALWLEQMLESRLGIADREVGGEIAR